MSKQTVVDLIFDNFNLLSDAEFKSWMLNKYDELKAVEKEQIIKAFKEGLKSPYHQDYTLVTQVGQEETKSGQYYNQTYGGDNE